MGKRISRCVELLQQDQAIYYDGPHSGHVLTHAQGRIDVGTGPDHMNGGMEHGWFDMAGVADYMRGMVDAGPTRSGHRTPTVIVEAPVNGIDAAHVRYNAWQFRQILGRGVHGILLCQAETADAVRAFVESCRYPHNTIGVDPGIPSPMARMEGAIRAKDGATDSAGRKQLSIGTRGRGSETTAAPIWGLSTEEYLERCDPWPLNPKGELLLGVKLESPEGVANCESILAVPGLGFAEIGPRAKPTMRLFFVVAAASRCWRVAWCRAAEGDGCVPRYLTASARVNPIIRGKAPVETGSLFTVSGDTGALAVASGNRVFISRRNPSSVSTLAAILAIRANSALLAATGLLAVSKAARSASPLINGAYFSRKRARPMASSASEYPTTARITSPFSTGFSGLKSRQRSA